MRWSLLLLMFLAVTALPTCSTKTQSQGKVKITYTRWGDPAEMESTRELIAEFERENPDIEVRVDVVGWEQYWQKMKTATVTNSAQDVWLMHPGYVEQYATGGHILDLMPFVNADPTFKLDDYFEGAFGYYSLKIVDGEAKEVPFGQGQLFALTRDTNCMLLYYNRDHFDAIGLPYPTANWTWDDLVAAAKKLTIDFDGDGVIDQWGYGGLEYQAFGSVIGAQFIDKSIHKCTYSSQLALQCIQFCQDLIYKYKVHSPPRIQVNEGDSFVTGKTSMLVSGSWEIRSYCRSDYRWDITLVPLDIKGRARHTSVGGMGHSIYARSQHPQEAWRLVRFLSGPVGQKALARSGTSVPILKSVAYSDDFLAGFDRPPKSSYHFIFESMIGGLPVPYANERGFLEYTRLIRTITDEVMRNRRTPKDACEEIDKRTNDIITEQYAKRPK
jgi:multiple sugar transport system substrate-binding protein